MSPLLPPVDLAAIADLKQGLAESVRVRVAEAVEAIVAAKQAGGKVAVVTGSGPNLHEGVTTLIAELMRLGLVDGVTTSSAVVAHEMAGTLDRVKRVDGNTLGLAAASLPHGGHFELTLLERTEWDQIASEFALDKDLITRLCAADGEEIIKAAGNMAYPLGYRTERIAHEVERLARIEGRSFEEIAGRGCDPRTMLGAGHAYRLPVVVTIPQLIGGGAVGLAIGDSISITERAARVARLLAEADVIIESAVALTQEIHDGPFETYTGHGIWAAWDGQPTFSLRGKRLIRIDLDENLDRVCTIERDSAAVQATIDQGLPKTKTFAVPFRMEMSGFARLPGSIPIIGDIGVIWPILASEIAARLGAELSFVSYPQQTDLGMAMRAAIAREVRPLSRSRLLDAAAPDH